MGDVMSKIEMFEVVNLQNQPDAQGLVERLEAEMKTVPSHGEDYKSIAARLRSAKMVLGYLQRLHVALKKCREARASENRIEVHRARLPRLVVASCVLWSMVLIVHGGVLWLNGGIVPGGDLRAIVVVGDLVLASLTAMFLSDPSVEYGHLRTMTDSRYRFFAQLYDEIDAWNRDVLPINSLITMANEDAIPAERIAQRVADAHERRERLEQRIKLALFQLKMGGELGTCQASIDLMPEKLLTHDQIGAGLEGSLTIPREPIFANASETRNPSD